jgi:HD-GYP domain-containing protein (c-di-GMP phosphodiesterase class II)
MNLRCRYCGMAIGGAPYTREDEAYCCEGCYLSTRLRNGLVLRQEDAQSALAEVLVAALDAREHETGLHSKRVACHTLVLARLFTNDAEVLRQVYLGALLHDVGKIGIPDAILRKHGPLSDSEWQVMRTHPDIGHRILAGVAALGPAAEIVLAHEERFDGSGYPRGLAGEAIPLWARLFALIDALDAMTSDRPYRKAIAFDAASSEIVRQAGAQFDPLAVDAFWGEQATLREMAAAQCGGADLAVAETMSTAFERR